MPKNIAPAANSAGVADRADVFSHIYDPAGGLRPPAEPKTTVYVIFFNNFHAFCAHSARESRHSYECARHLAPVCRDHERARAMRAPWSWGAFGGCTPNPVPPLRLSFLIKKL